MPAYTRSLSFVVLFAIAPIPAAAQAVAQPPTMSDGSLTALSRPPSLPGSPSLPTQVNQPRRDSLWNGALAGAGLGAVLGAFVGLGISDCNECSGFNVPLTYGILGAGVGAGIGAGIDALLARTPPAVWARKARRVDVSPLLGTRVRGVVGLVRF
jgi:hypothetical protein